MTQHGRWNINTYKGYQHTVSRGYKNNKIFKIIETVKCLYCYNEYWIANHLSISKKVQKLLYLLLAIMRDFLQVSKTCQISLFLWIN